MARNRVKSSSAKIDVDAQDEIGKDTHVTLQLGSGDRYIFEDGQGMELAMLEVGLEGDPVMSLYVYDPRGKLLGHFSLWNK